MTMIDLTFNFLKTTKFSTAMLLYKLTCMNPPMFGHLTPRPEGVEADVAMVIPHASVNLLVQPEQKEDCYCHKHFFQNILMLKKD